MEQVRAFVEGNEAVDYKHQDRSSAYAFVSELLGRLRYRILGKRDKGRQPFGGGHISIVLRSLNNFSNMIVSP